MFDTKAGVKNRAVSPHDPDEHISLFSPQSPPVTIVIPRSGAAPAIALATAGGIFWDMRAKANE